MRISFAAIAAVAFFLLVSCSTPPTPTDSRPIEHEAGYMRR